MNAFLQRLTDWVREVRICRLRAKAVRMVHQGRREAARPVAERMYALCNARSSAQVARMERDQGLDHA